MLIEQRPLSAITPYPDNPREIPEAAVQGVAESIRRYGFRQPIVVDTDGVIIVGHVRLLAAQQLGLETAPVHVADLTPDEARAYRLADNRSNENATWDDAGLLSELQALASVADNDLSELAAMTAFGEHELQALLLAEIDPEPDEVDPPEPRAKLGDLWVLGRHRLLCGDSSKADDVAQLLNGEVPRLMVTDPPFGVQYDPEWRIAAVEEGRLSFGKPVRTDYMEPSDDVDSDYAGVWGLSPATVGYIWQGHGALVPTAIALDDLGWERRGLLVWYKQSPVIARGPYAYQSEFCWYAVRKGQKAEWIGPKSQSQVWSIGWEGGTSHAAQKPVECMERPIRNHKGDVYDPFVGSGTTIIAAERQGRACYAMEIEPRYVDMAVVRWEDLTGETAVLETS